MYSIRKPCVLNSMRMQRFCWDSKFTNFKYKNSSENEYCNIIIIETNTVDLKVCQEQPKIKLYDEAIEGVKLRPI